MRKLMVSLFAVTLLAAGQDKGSKTPEKFDFKGLMQQIWAGWEQGPDVTAKFYAKEPGRVFYDIAPLKYNGWTQYDSGVRKMLAEYSGAKFTLNPDARASQRGATFAWGTATLHATLTKKDGVKEEMDLRWTVLWEKKDADWLIVHEHVSAPIGPPPAPAPAPPAKKKAAK